MDIEIVLNFVIWFEVSSLHILVTDIAFISLVFNYV